MPVKKNSATAPKETSLFAPISRRELLQVARSGYEARIAQIDRELSGGNNDTQSWRSKVAALMGPGTASNDSQQSIAPKTVSGKRKMSAEGRERIAAATRKRWAKFRAAKAAEGKK